jgi:hypothetical protein
MLFKLLSFNIEGKENRSARQNNELKQKYSYLKHKLDAIQKIIGESTGSGRTIYNHNSQDPQLWKT